MPAPAYAAAASPMMAVLGVKVDSHDVLLRRACERCG